MKFSIDRETLLEPLLRIQGVVERRQTLPILGNLLISSKDKQLSVTGTDMEVELVARVTVEGQEGGEITVPARKFIYICRALPTGANINMAVTEGKAVI